MMTTLGFKKSLGRMVLTRKANQQQRKINKLSVNGVQVYKTSVRNFVEVV